ncbi:MAG: hypothetical protein ACTSSK_18050 [Candidatus Heimdallarchaeota archaeon]
MARIKIEVSEIKGKCDNGMEVGDHLIIHDGKISIPNNRCNQLYLSK